MSEIAQKRTKRALVVAAGVLVVAGMSQFFLEFFDTDRPLSALLFLLAASASFGALALHFWNRRRARPFVVAIAVICTLGTIILAFAGRSIGVAAQLEYNQRRWDAQRITSYRYTLRRGCYCPVEVTNPARIEVRNGVPVSITYVDSGAAADAHFFAEVATIDNIFQTIEESNANGAAYLSVVYDPILGYPTNISIKHAEQAFDDQISYEITDFEAIH